VSCSEGLVDVSSYRFLEDKSVLYTRQHPKPSRIDVGLNELELAGRQELRGMKPQKGTGQRVGNGGPTFAVILGPRAHANNQ
jgi:hypothetical protein